MGHYEIVVHKTAETDIRDAIGYFSKTLREPNTARAMSKRFQEAIMSLSSMPERFPIVPDNYLGSTEKHEYVMNSPAFFNRMT